MSGGGLGQSGGGLGQSGGGLGQSGGGGGLGQRYRLTEFHLHWGEDDDTGSEHRVDGIAFPLELHAVTIKDNFRDVREALDSGDKQALAVMAVFFVNKGTYYYILVYIFFHLACLLI